MIDMKLPVGTVAGAVRERLDRLGAGRYLRQWEPVAALELAERVQ